MNELCRQISQCTICENQLAHTPRPVFSFSVHSKIVIIGQAPGAIVHDSGVPWNDKSGENLRKWMGVVDGVFYDSSKVAIVPMGFCYPGKGKSGDLPPRKECAPLWHDQILDEIIAPELTLLIGKYAQDYYLKEKSKKNLTETVLHFEEYLPKYFVLPHPSPRNNIWQAKNRWFGKDVLPKLNRSIDEILN
tara:strand:+ start:442 stop:1014 length:573 start_codon:yes stop_codon:yes gene_type:complete